MGSLMEKLQNLTVSEAVTYGVCAIAGTVGAVSLIVTAAGTPSYREDRAAAEAQLSAKKGELQVAKGESEARQNGTDDAVMTEDEFSQAVSDGEVLDGTAYGDDGSGEVDPDLDGAMTDEILQGLHGCSVEGTNVAGIQGRYIATPLDAPDVGDTISAKRDGFASLLEQYIDGPGRQSWYDPCYLYQAGTAAQFTWKFESGFSFEGASCPVVWTCRRNIDNSLCAYTTALFDVYSGKFTHVEPVVTEAGYLLSVAGKNASDAEVLNENSVTSTGYERDADGMATVSGNDLESGEIEEDGGWSDDEWENLFSDQDEESEQEILDIENANEQGNGVEYTGNPVDAGLPAGFFD